VKSGNGRRAVREVFGGLPGGIRATDPTDKVLEVATNEAGIENLFDFEFFVTVDNNRRRWRLNLADKRVGSNRFQEGDVEDWMDLHRSGEL
jgi:hypothetical protein